MGFTKSDLYFNDYNWSTDDDDDPRYKKYLDRIKVDKTEGYEVVYFCNDFLQDYKKPLTVANFKKAERILRSNILSNIQLRSTLNTKIDELWTTFLLFERA